MKWYEHRSPYTGDHYWWTQRDKDGNCFEVRPSERRDKFWLIMNGLTHSAHGSLSQAQQAASLLWKL